MVLHTGTNLLVSTLSSEFSMETEANETDGKRAKKALQRQESQPAKPARGTVDILQATASVI